MYRHKSTTKTANCTRESELVGACSIVSIGDGHTESTGSVSIRLETFTNHLAPSFLSDDADASSDRRTRRSHRIGSLLVISTIESDGLATQEALEREVLDAIVDILSG